MGKNLVNSFANVKTKKFRDHGGLNYSVFTTKISRNNFNKKGIYFAFEHE